MISQLQARTPQEHKFYAVFVNFYAIGFPLRYTKGNNNTRVGLVVYTTHSQQGGPPYRGQPPYPAHHPAHHGVPDSETLDSSEFWRQQSLQQQAFQQQSFQQQSFQQQPFQPQDFSGPPISYPTLVDPTLLRTARQLYRQYYEAHPDITQRPVGVAVNRQNYRGKLIFGQKPVLLPQECFIPFEQLQTDLY
jgi:hypothetical protein